MKNMKNKNTRRLIANVALLLILAFAVALVIGGAYLLHLAVKFTSTYFASLESCLYLLGGFTLLGSGIYLLLSVIGYDNVMDVIDKLG